MKNKRRIMKTLLIEFLCRCGGSLSERTAYLSVMKWLLQHHKHCIVTALWEVELIAPTCARVVRVRREEGGLILENGAVYFGGGGGTFNRKLLKSFIMWRQRRRKFLANCVSYIFLFPLPVSFSLRSSPRQVSLLSVHFLTVVGLFLVSVG
jgi:hypothetical protein